MKPVAGSGAVGVIDVNDELVLRGEAVEIEDHPGHVHVVRQRLREPVGVSRLHGQRRGRVGERGLRRASSFCAAATLASSSVAFERCGATTRNQAAARRTTAPTTAQRDRRLLVFQQAVHQEPPVFRSAAIWKWTTDFVPFCLDLARRERDVGERRERREAGQQAGDVGLGVRVAVDLSSGRGARDAGRRSAATGAADPWREHLRLTARPARRSRAGRATRHGARRPRGPGAPRTLATAWARCAWAPCERGVDHGPRRLRAERRSGPAPRRAGPARR